MSGNFAQVHTVVSGDTPRLSPARAAVGKKESKEGSASCCWANRIIRRKDQLLADPLKLLADPLKVRIEHLRDEVYTNDDIMKATSMEIVNTMRDLLHLNPLYGEQFRTLLTLTGSVDLQTVVELGSCARLNKCHEETLQSILDHLSSQTECRLCYFVEEGGELCKLQAIIRDQWVESKFMKEQRRMMLMEQVKSIKKELGLTTNNKSALVQKFIERFEPKRAVASEEAVRVVDEEIIKLSALEPASPEFNITRNYVEWLTSLPWGTFSEEIFDIKQAKEVLDADHHGLDDVKERIPEFIAVSALRGSAMGNILFV
eukprot:gene29217-7193_t